MKTASYDEVMGTIKMGIQKKNLIAVIGDPGAGKSSLLDDVVNEYPNAHRILCSPTMSPKDMLTKIAASLQVHTKGDTNKVKDQLTEELIHDPNHILLFDEGEYLNRKGAEKLDILRQIYDESNVPMVLCGTYRLKNMLTTADKNHNQPQITRRLLKAEFKPVTKEEFTTYLDQLEELFVIHFKLEARNELFSLCTDAENGGLGIFIYFLENTLPFVRHEWEDICEAYKMHKSYDTSRFEKATIDKALLKQTSRFLMTR